MAALQKVRNRGKLIVAIIGLALFGFLIEEGVKACASNHQDPEGETVVSVGDAELSYRELNKLVEEQKTLAEAMGQSIDDQQVRDQVWQQYQYEQAIKNECDKLGIIVSEAELQEVLNNGQSRALQTSPFAMGGGYDATAVSQMLKNLGDAINDPQQAGNIAPQYIALYNSWDIVVKQVKFELLSQKYFTLLSQAVVSNPVSAKVAYDASSVESKIRLAVLPYSSINDNDVTVEESDLKAKYKEMKENFVNQALAETRNIKYIAVKVVPSQADIDSLQSEMNRYAEQMKTTENPAKLVREAESTVSYFSVPVTKAALPHEVAEMIDSMSVGTTVGPVAHNHDGVNTLTIVRLNKKVTLPDTIKVRVIAPNNPDAAAWEKSADSIMTALKAGENIDTLAVKYNKQATTEEVITSSQYQTQAMNSDFKNYIETISTAAVGSYNLIEMQGMKFIVKVTAQSNMVSKYDVAIIKREQKFSAETYDNECNKFKSFLASNRNLEDLEANALKNGYIVQSQNYVGNSARYIGNGMDRISNVGKVISWMFDDASVGEVSQDFECGELDHIMCVAVTAVNDKDYLSLEDEDVKQAVKEQVLNDKKAAKLQEKMKSAKSIDAVASMAGALSDTISNVGMMSIAYINVTGQQEPAISGAVSGSKQGDFKSGIKGNGGVYAFQVLEQTKSEVPFDEKNAMQGLAQNALGNIQNRFMYELMRKGGFTDIRYKRY